MAEYEDLEQHLEDDPSEAYDEDDDIESRGSSAKHVTRIVCCLGCIFGPASVLLCVLLSLGTGMPDAIAKRNEEKLAEVNLTQALNASKIQPWQLGVASGMIGTQDLNQLSATVLALIAFLSVVIATCVSTLEVNRNPELVPNDFETKGTLSNVSQDISQPNGRMFSVGLFTFGLMLLNSAYTTWNYRSWAPNVSFSTDLQPFQGPPWQPYIEKIIRTVWVTWPNALFMFTAAFPSLSDATGYKFYLMLIHNICAPIGMAIFTIMETIQLSYGENAFAFFFSSLPTPVYGPLTVLQRARVVTVFFAWICFIVFLGVQIYLGLGSMLGQKIKTCYALALVSYYGEVIGLNLVALLPTLAGFDMIMTDLGIPNYAAEAFNAIGHGLNFQQLSPEL